MPSNVDPNTPSREALATLKAASQVLRNFRLPELRSSARAVEKLGAMGAEPRKPEPSVLEEARRVFVAAAASGRFGDVTIKHFNAAPWLLWAENHPLAAVPRVFESIVGFAEHRGSARRKLIHAWLFGFAPAAPRIEEGGHAIRWLLGASKDHRLESWRRADRVLALFDARVGPHRVAQAVLSSIGSIDDILRIAGLAEPLLAVGGYSRAVQTQILEQVGAALAKPGAEDIFARCAAFLAPDAHLRFEESAARGAVADGLLAPWLRGAMVPSDSVRAAVQTFLLHHLGDPRIRPQHWKNVREEATGLMRRWLTRASLDAFFQLISEHAYDRHWRYREAFWSACLRKGAIDDAWLALGSQVHASARSVKDLDGAYGRLRGGSSTHAILLLRIGNDVFCEWSHNGRLRAWPKDWPTAPHLGAAEYTRSEVMGASLPFPACPPRNRSGAPNGQGLDHSDSEKGWWQSSAAELLARRTGLRLTPEEWMPR